MSKKSKLRKLEHNNSSKKKKRSDSDSDDSDAEKEKAGGEEELKRKKSQGNNSSDFTQFNISASSIPTPSFDKLTAFTKCFWIGPMDVDGATDDSHIGPSAALKEVRKNLGVLVKGNTAGCPPPVTALTAKPLVGNDAYSENWLPACFSKVFQQLNLHKPSPIQMQSWPAILYGSNTLCISPTGSGKTLAYSLPAVPHIQAQGTQRRRGPVVLVLVPTRELAIQV
jgi:ATP-dependent helicase YprA (DUF1998 family)